MALAQRFTNTGVLQTVGNIVEDSLNIEPIIVTSTSNTPHAIAAWPTGVTGTGLTNTGTGTFNWTCPAGITSICVVAVGGGGKGGGGGGGGGGLGWKNNITVVPGNVYTVVAGAPGTNSANGGDSYFISTATVKGGGGSSATTTLGTGNTSGGTYTGDGGGNGGSGSAITTWGGGGGGAGGYSGAGGDGGNGTGASFPSGNGSNGSGGGGGGGSAHSTSDSNDTKRKGGGGGGVGLFGQGSNGAGAISSNFGGDPGSGGSSGGNGVQGDASNGGAGGTYGGGGGGSNDPSGGFSNSPGAGAVRIIWGTGRSFPTNSEFATGITNHTTTRLFQNGNFYITGTFDEITLSDYANRSVSYSIYNYGLWNSNPLQGSVLTSSGGGAIFNVQATNWTVETWFKAIAWWDNFSGTGGQLFGGTSSATYKFTCYFNTTGSQLNLTDGTNTITATLNSIPSLNVWHHIAIVCNTTITVYIDGVAQTSFFAKTNTLNASGTTTVNQWRLAGGSGTQMTWHGYLSQFRINNSTSVYSGTLTSSVPIVPLTSITNTKLLTAQASTITDSSGTFTITNTGGVTVSSTVTPFSSTYYANTYSYFFNGSSYLTIGPTTAQDWTAADTKIEAWVYPTSTTGLSYSVGGKQLPTLIGDADIASNSRSWGFGLNSSLKASLFYVSFPGSVYITVDSTATVSLNTWSHIAMTYKIGSGITLYVNGVAETTTALVGGLLSASTPSFGFLIGAGGAGSIVYLNAYVSDLRVVQGVQVFTPPPKLTTTQSSGINISSINSGTILLTFNSPTLVDNSSNAFTLTRVNNGALIISGDVPSNPATFTSSTALRKQYSTEYDVFDSIDEVSLAYSITPDKLLANEGDTVTYTVNAPLLGTGTLYYTNAGTMAAADFTGGLVYGVTPLTWAGTATATLWSFTGITPLSTSGFGTGVVFSIRKNNATTAMGTYGVLTVIPTSPGSGYTIGDTIVISGASLGLTVGTNNLTITVGSDWFAQVVYSATITGTGMVTSGTGTANWTCPDGVYRISVAAVGGGGGGGSGAGAGAGGGGGAGYITDIAVTPGLVYPVAVGVGGTSAINGGPSSFQDVNTSTLLNCNGGNSGFVGYSGDGGTVTVGTGFAGGAGGLGSASPAAQGGGGGAGGFTAAGGNGGTAFGAFLNLSIQVGKNSASGGGGGSSGGGAGALDSVGTAVNTSTGNGGGGGGILLLGASNLGVGGVNLAGSTGAILGQSGLGGSGGATGGAASATVGGAGGAQGGGGGGGSTTGGAGGAGALRIIWNYPHGFLPEQTALTAVTNTKLLTAQAAMVSLNATDTTSINTITNYGGTITAVASPTPFASTFSNGAFATASYLTVYLPPKTWNPTTDTTWTLEGWIYMTTTGQFCLVSGQTAGTTVFYIQWGGSTLVVTDGTNTPVSWNITQTTLTATTWFHIALVNNGGTLNLYVGGVLRSSGANTLTSNAIDTLVLGKNLASGGYALSGNLSNFRLVKGTAVYSGASFTVPTTALTAITNTLVLTCQSSTTVIDNSSSPSQVTSTGSTTAVTATIPFASTYSYQFNGTTQYLTIPSSSNFVFGATDDFTIEGYLYTSATTINKGLIYKRTNVSAFSSVNFGTSTTTASRFTLKVANPVGSGWTINDETAGTFAINTWYHFAITKTNGVIYLYLNGLLTRQYAHTTAIYDDGSVLNIGRDPGGSFWVGFLSNIRIIKGTALYYPPSTIVNRNYPDYPYVVQNSGSVTITNGTGTIALPIGQDILQEGVQDIQLQLRSDSTSGTILATSSTVLVADTSLPLASPGGGQCWCAWPDYISGSNLTYTGTLGSFTFTAPKGYTTVSVVCIGGGGSGGFNGASGGGGGALSYIASFAVTAGSTYAVVAGYPGGNPIPVAQFGTYNGGPSSFNTSTVIANGGTAGNGTTAGTGGTVGAGTGFAGGAGGVSLASSASGGGGGGAGGYTAAGGVGGATSATSLASPGVASATGGAGGAGGGSTTANVGFGSGGGGGGTAPFGSVAVASVGGLAQAGPTGIDGSGRGGGGSGGIGTNLLYGAALGQRGGTAGHDRLSRLDGGGRPDGGEFGGGGGGASGSSDPAGYGGRGSVRIIWGTGRAYPATLTTDRVSGFPAAVGNPAGQQ